MRRINNIVWNALTEHAPKQVAVKAEENDECYIDGNVLFLIQQPCSNVVAYAVCPSLKNVKSFKNFLKEFAGTNRIVRIEEYKKGHYDYLERTLKAPAVFFTMENNKKVYYLNFNLVKGEDII